MSTKIIRNREEARDAYLARPITLQFPAFEGFVVTEAHARLCREKGHTEITYSANICQRCGDPVSA